MSTTRIKLSKLVDILGLWLANKVTFLDLVKDLKILSKRRTLLISGHWPQSLMVSANWRTDRTYLSVHISYNFVFCILILLFLLHLFYSDLRQWTRMVDSLSMQTGQVYGFKLFRHGCVWLCMCGHWLHLLLVLIASSASQVERPKLDVFLYMEHEQLLCMCIFDLK